MVYDSICDKWYELRGELRSIVEDEFQKSYLAMIKNQNDEKLLAWYNAALKKKDALNKDINFYEHQLDDSIKQNNADMFLQQFKAFRSILQNKYNRSASGIPVRVDPQFFYEPQLDSNKEEPTIQGRYSRLPAAGPQGKMLF